MHGAILRPATALLLLAVLSPGLYAETWYALAESMDVRPYGYLYYSGEVPAVYGGARSRRAVMRQVYSIETLGQRTDGENYKEFHMEPEGGLVGFIARQKANDATEISDGEFRKDGLYIRRYTEGSPPDAAPRRTVPPKDIFFATSPSFLWPMVRDSETPVAFNLYDIMTFSIRPTVARPAGMRAVRIRGKSWNTRKVLMETYNSQGALQYRQALYFDTAGGLLVLSENLDRSGKPESVMYLADKDVVKDHAARVIRPDVLPAKRLPFVPDRPYLYTVSIKSGELGRGFFMLNASTGVGRYGMEEKIRLVGPQEERKGSAALHLGSDLGIARYRMSGKVVDPTGKNVNVGYSRGAICTGKSLDWDAWVIDHVAGNAAKKITGTYDLTDSVYVIDDHLFSGLAVLASQVPLSPGMTARVGMYHANLHSLGMMNLTVGNKATVGDRSLYVVDLVGFCGRYVLYVQDDGILRRAVLVLGPQGERDITYEVVE
ncbi:MAG: hypothetical protein JW909_08120 [Planctomycetes bacterium]|nr:hypothetical protein [Planctomycetota bacterium]